MTRRVIRTDNFIGNRTAAAQATNRLSRKKSNSFLHLQSVCTVPTVELYPFIDDDPDLAVHEVR